ncbi:MAG: polyketide cyclase [Bdellovibrio sp. CG12_big_fil_rev_8_21_14_0_65_39_13]|nr:MAG: polyketide cyclase [Bdellovibrio sp. CG22_combo_CG10-13_8_21_14_all_39_27]PIQ58648.1 MAG: polyketide cyclase [Bdellovibrio sp. CG12_big_fil_rev_8_21_14_0_65_39_13]PIR33023.1 MAG: polyketide cyclase [Bdellovibrio sp. CG11_big_fil_rev_8_21_14_0_20_39_38]
MKLKLPKIIETYVEASNASDLESTLSCFSPKATVLDEGETLSGHDAISTWFRKTRAKYQFKAKPIAFEDKGEEVILKAQVSGNFPGSPVNLDYKFKIKSGLIEDLRII